MTNRERYDRAAHCMQAGVKIEAPRNGENIQTRVGVNVALRDHASLVQLLVSKGIITQDEYEKAIADGMEDEVRAYEERIQGGSQVKITLVGRLGSIHDEKTP